MRYNRTAIKFEYPIVLSVRLWFAVEVLAFSISIAFIFVIVEFPYLTTFWKSYGYSRHEKYSAAQNQLLTTSHYYRTLTIEMRHVSGVLLMINSLFICGWVVRCFIFGQSGFVLPKDWSPGKLSGRFEQPDDR